MKKLSLFTLLITLLITSLLFPPAHAFCGFYVAKADTKLFNKASQVVLVRDGDRTVLTMSNDFKGDPEEFAVVIPVPTFIEKNQIHIGDKAVIDHLDAYTAPRLVEYFDENPCLRVEYDLAQEAMPSAAKSGESRRRDKSLGVTVEAQYTVGEYDIVILSAEQSDGLTVWLKENGYRIPDGAENVLGSYIKQNMRFFVAKVNLAEQSKLGFSYLRPIQVAYESRKFMLPVRLGTVNADGPQELFIYALTRQGRVETTNYRTIKLPTGMDLPVYIKNEFGDFYRDMFSRQVERENMRTVFLEYAWDMNWCDPCAADPLSVKELRSLGVFWVNPDQARGPARDVFVTRLHLRYTADKFPEDLMFQTTGDRSNFQGRYVLRHPWQGSDDCPAARDYRRNLKKRLEQEAQTLSNLTGWNINRVRNRLNMPETSENNSGDSWWDQLWK